MLSGGFVADARQTRKGAYARDRRDRGPVCALRGATLFLTMQPQSASGAHYDESHTLLVSLCGERRDFYYRRDWPQRVRAVDCARSSPSPIRSVPPKSPKTPVTTCGRATPY